MMAKDRYILLLLLLLLLLVAKLLQCMLQELQLQSDVSSGKPPLRPESRSQAEVAADQLVGRATSEILM